MHPKYTIIFVFLILAFKATGQELPLGTFSLSTGFTYRQFTFKENNRFDYLFSSCTGGEKGSGTFVYENKNLTLTFTDSIGKTEPLKPVFTKENSATDTSLIHFILFDQKDSAKLSGVTLKWKKKRSDPFYNVE